MSIRLGINPLTWTIDDPAYFKTPVTQTEVFVRSRRDPEPYDCKPGYRSRDLWLHADNCSVGMSVLFPVAQSFR